MSLHAFPSSVGDPLDARRWDRIEAIEDLCGRHIRQAVVTDDGVVLQLEFDPDLDAEEEAKLQRIMALPFSSLLTFDEWVLLRQERDLLRTYVGASSPTAAQTVAAVKALTRIVRMIVRD